MFIDSPILSLILMSLSLLFWGSWANMIKVAKGIRFEIFYIDFVIGALFTSILVGLTMGTWGHYGLPFLESLVQSHFPHILRAFLAGVLFNIANILLVAAAAFSGISYAFMTCFGVAVIIDTLMAYITVHFQKSVAFSFGILFIIMAVSCITIAQRKIPYKIPLAKRTLTLTIVSGILIGLFYPLLEKSLDIPGEKRLGPYAASFFFSCGLIICNLFINPILMAKPIFGHPITLDSYVATKLKKHSFGIIGGAIWSLGLSSKLLADLSVTPLIKFISMEGAVLLTIFWGIFLWREIPKAMGLYRYIFLGILSFVLGLVLIGFSRFG